MFTTLFPPVLTPIPLRQADIYQICEYYYISYISVEENSAAQGGRRRRQDRGDARRGKSGPLCAR